MLPLQALWLPVFQRTFRDVKKKGRETLHQVPHWCVYPLSTWCYLRSLHSTSLVPRSLGDKAVYNTHERISEAFLPHVRMLQAKTGDLGMWLVSNRTNLFGGPWQSWSVSNLCFRQKFLRQVLQVTGTSWRRKQQNSS